MNLQSTSTPIYGGTGGQGGQGGLQGGSGGVGQGNTVRINTESVQVYNAQPDEYDKIMDFLSPINFRQRQQEIFQARQEGTGNWFLEDTRFLEWKSGSTQVLWCSGIPDCKQLVLEKLFLR
ncbi:Ankyrin repeat protein [Mycena chlorophos]|uniref:Ankyrin repeat protein n=1 Tax=Mycena chlorophos TaxID=658473 RepID=A0A8H6SVU4_MYCCL|nr:Ankyrin repeat protein [Mycena chlorophos]